MALDQLTPGVWTLDASHSTVGFTVRHMMVSKVRGSFADFSAAIEIAADPLQSTLSADVKMASIQTGDEGRDNHLRTNDFFDVEQHPLMTFRSTSFRRDGDDFVMVGDLTVKGVTKQVEFALEFGGVGQDPWGSTRAGFTASTTINRRDFGVEWNAPLETGGVLVGDKVTIALDIEIVKA